GPAAELVVVLLEHAPQPHDAGVAGGIVGRLRAGPGILVPADHDEVVGLALDLAHRDFERAPAVLDIGAKPHPHRAALEHLAQLESGAARDTDAGQGRHFALEGLRRRVAPYRFDR